MNNDTPLLQIVDLQTSFKSETGYVPAVDGVSFTVGRGECVGLVGESGSGKTLTSLSILGLVPKPGGAITRGQVFFEGTDLVSLPEDKLRAIRGNRISMIFQEPMTSLDPVYTIGAQLGDVISLHQGVGVSEARQRAAEMLRLVGIPNPEERLRQYPHNLSGGMRQRVMIAMALSCRPKLMIADEPTTALDVTIQAQVLEVLKALRREIGMSLLLITHALGVVAEIAERVVVMYAGKVVEEAPVRDLFHDPRHPYTAGLLASVPRMDAKKQRLHVIEGTVPSITSVPSGCRFHPRCPHAEGICKVEEPHLLEISPGRTVRCHMASGHAKGGVA